VEAVGEGPGAARTNDPLPPALVARADRPGLAPLWAELARRLGASDRPVRTVRLTGLDGPQREALADLLGRSSLPAADTTVPVAAVCRSLRIGEVMLAQLVAAVHGPLDNRSARRAAAARARDRLWEEVAAAVADRGLDGWVARLRAAGVPDGDVEAHRGRLAPVVAVVAALPLDRPVPLAVVAHRHLGDPHALDQGTWAGAVVTDAAAGLAGLPPPTTAEQARAALSHVGIVSDQLSVPVLSLGLRGPGGAPDPGWLAAMADAGEPVTLTASQLRRWPLSASAGVVHVVENPSIVAAAAAASVSAPLVCTASWPTHAAVLLLDQLRSGGAHLHYHGDMDPTGLVLTEHHRRRFGAQPWRMGASDYLAAVGAATVSIEDGTTIPATPWDPALADAVRTHRRVVFEEQVLDDLLADLRR
jgi:uncharacterized protein (TIGR02679 family)